MGVKQYEVLKSFIGNDWFYIKDSVITKSEIVGISLCSGEVWFDFASKKDFGKDDVVVQFKDGNRIVSSNVSHSVTSLLENIERRYNNTKQVEYKSVNIVFNGTPMPEDVEVGSISLFCNGRDFALKATKGSWDYMGERALLKCNIDADMSTDEFDFNLLPSDFKDEDFDSSFYISSEKVSVHSALLYVKIGDDIFDVHLTVSQ